MPTYPRGLKQSSWRRRHQNWILKDEYTLFKEAGGRGKGPSSVRGQSNQKHDASRGLAWAEHVEGASVVRA